MSSLARGEDPGELLPGVHRIASLAKRDRARWDNAYAEGIVAALAPVRMILAYHRTLLAKLRHARCRTLGERSRHAARSVRSCAIVSSARIA